MKLDRLQKLLKNLAGHQSTKTSCQQMEAILPGSGRPAKITPRIHFEILKDLKKNSRVTRKHQQKLCSCIIDEKNLYKKDVMEWIACKPHSK